MAELSGLQVFKYLPAAKKLPDGNCKKCGFPTCMAFALKLAKNQAEIELCPHVPDELKEIFEQGMKKPQEEVLLGHKNKVLVGGENVLYRHDKTFINKTAIGIVLDVSKSDWEEKLKRITDFEITRISDTFKIDLVYLKGMSPSYQPSLDDGINAIINDFVPPHPSPLPIMARENSKNKYESGEGVSSLIELTQKLDDLGFAWVVEEDLNELTKVEDGDFFETIKTLTNIRKKAVLQKDEIYSKPVYLYFEHTDDILKLMSKASSYLCKYANILVFEDFNEALISTLMTLRQNIFTDPQKPLQVESKIYEFNNADENSLVFLTTNFALTYFAVANEIEALNRPAYLVVTPSDGMSVLTAWSAEKFTAQIAAKTVNQFQLAKKVKNKQIIIPGLLAHMKEELEEAMPDFEIIVGTNEAYLIGDFVKSLEKN